MPKPLRKIVHTMGWPLRTSASFGEFGGSFIYPMGDDLVTVGFVAGLESSRRRVLRARRPAGVQDAPARLEDPRRRRARRVGREDDHRGRLLLAPAEVQRAGAPARRRGRRARQRAAAQGRPLRDRVGTARRRGGVPRAPARRGRVAGRRARLLRRVAAREPVLEGALRGAEHAPGVRQGLLRRRRAREHDDRDEGACSERPPPDASERRRAAEEDGPRVPLPDARTATTSSTSSRRSSRRGTARATTSRTTSRCGRRSGGRSPRRGSGCARRTCTRSAATSATGW